MHAIQVNGKSDSRKIEAHIELPLLDMNNHRTRGTHCHSYGVLQSFLLAKLEGNLDSEVETAVHRRIPGLKHLLSWAKLGWKLKEGPVGCFFVKRLRLLPHVDSLLLLGRSCIPSSSECSWRIVPGGLLGSAEDIESSVCGNALHQVRQQAFIHTRFDHKKLRRVPHATLVR